MISDTLESKPTESLALAVEITVSHLYVTDQTWKRYNSVCEALGWYKKSLLTQFLQGYAKSNLAYYQKAAEMDAIARGFSEHQGEHFRLLRDWGDIQQLHPFTKTQPAFERTPLTDIQIVTNASDRRSFSTMKCSARSSAILHLATIIERSSVPLVMSKILINHFDKFWLSSYAPQLAANEQETLTPDFLKEIDS